MEDCITAAVGRKYRHSTILLQLNQGFYTKGDVCVPGTVHAKLNQLTEPKSWHV